MQKSYSFWLVLIMAAVLIGLQYAMVKFVGDDAILMLLILNGLAVALYLPWRVMEGLNSRLGSQSESKENFRIKRFRLMARGDLDHNFSLDKGDMGRAERAFVVKTQELMLAFSLLSQTVDAATAALQNEGENLANQNDLQDRGLERLKTGSHDLTLDLARVQELVRKINSSMELVHNQTSQLLQQGNQDLRGSGKLMDRTRRLANGLRSLSTGWAVHDTEISRLLQEVGSLDHMESFGLQKNNQEVVSKMTSSVSSFREDLRGCQESLHELIGLGESSQHLSESLEELREHGSQASMAMDNIADISKQTNLLSLNASIIAAQSGQYGNKFSVVAEEVRDLAMRMDQSTKELSLAMRNMNESSDSARETVTQSQSTSGRSLETLAEKMVDLQDVGLNLEKYIHEVESREKSLVTAQAEITRQVHSLSKTVSGLSARGEDLAEAGTNLNHLAADADSCMQSLDNTLAGHREWVEGLDSLRRHMRELVGLISQVDDLEAKLNKSGHALDDQADDNRRSLTTSKHSLAAVSELAVDLAGLSHQVRLSLEGLRLPAARRGGILRTAYNPSIGVYFDKDRTFDVRHTQYAGMVFDGLVGFRRGTQLEPMLARAWDVSADGKTYTFHLRQNVRFHNGDLLTSSHVRESWLRAIDPDTKSESAWIFDVVQGVPELNEINDPVARKQAFDQARDNIAIQTPADHTLVVQLKEAISFFVKSLNLDSAKVCHKDFLEDMENQPIGTGPFILKSRSQDRLTLVRNPHYFLEGCPYVEELHIDIGISDNNIIYEQFRKGKYDYIMDLPQGARQEIAADPASGLMLSGATQLTTTFLVYGRSGVEGDPLEDIRVRRAIQHGVDVDAILRDVHDSAHERARGIIPPGLFGHNAHRGLADYNPKKAKAMLNEAGFPGGFDIPCLLGKNRTNPNRDEEMMAEMLDEIGIRLRFEEGTASEHYREVIEGKASPRPIMFRGGWTCDFPDPDNILYILFHSRNLSVIEFRHNNPKVDEYLEKARSAFNLAERQMSYRQAEDLILEDAPCVLLYHSKVFVAHKEGLRGVRVNAVPPAVRESEIWFENVQD